MAHGTAHIPACWTWTWPGGQSQQRPCAFPGSGRHAERGPQLDVAGSHEAPHEGVPPAQDSSIGFGDSW